MSSTGPQQPLRLAMIGLSASAITSWAADAHLPNLLTIRGRRDYSIMALCNSSVSAAKAAVTAFGLNASETRAYGSPDDLAKDADVDVVVCNTRVDKHYETILPSVKAGKDVYVEWPIASNTAQIDELVATAKTSGSRVAVGLQGRWSPPILKLKEILHSGIVGRLLSSEVHSFGGTVSRDSLSQGLKYFADRKVGGNPMTIGFGHLIDWVQSVVGDLEPSTTHAQLQLQRRNVRIRGSTPEETVEYVNSDVPDLVHVHGTVPGSDAVAQGATLSVNFRAGQPFPGHPSLIWTLNCEKGEIRLTTPLGVSLQADAFLKPPVIEVHDFSTNEVKEVAWSWSEEQLEVPIRGRVVQGCLYAFAEGNDQGWVSLEDGAKRARQIQTWLDGAKV